MGDGPRICVQVADCGSKVGLYEPLVYQRRKATRGRIVGHFVSRAIGRITDGTRDSRESVTNTIR
jgi:hypothetical protein